MRNENSDNDSLGKREKEKEEMKYTHNETKKRHCERSEAIQNKEVILFKWFYRFCNTYSFHSGLLLRSAHRNDGIAVMRYLSIVLIAIIGLLFPSTLTAQSNNGNDTVFPFFSKAQIEEKLKNLPINPSGDWSYWQYHCRSYIYVIYICPKCGTETRYDDLHKWLTTLGKEEFIWNNSEYFDSKFNRLNSESNAFCYVLDIKVFREEIRKIKGIHIALDESEFCKNCYPYFIENPTLYLLTNIEGESDTIKTANISWLDIRLLQFFLNGSITNRNKMPHEKPISFSDAVKEIEYINRIKELLGIKEEIK